MGRLEWLLKSYARSIGPLMTASIEPLFQELQESAVPIFVFGKVFFISSIQLTNSPSEYAAKHLASETFPVGFVVFLFFGDSDVDLGDYLLPR